MDARGGKANAQHILLGGDVVLHRDALHVVHVTEREEEEEEEEGGKGQTFTTESLSDTLLNPLLTLHQASARLNKLK